VHYLVGKCTLISGSGIAPGLVAAGAGGPLDCLMDEARRAEAPGPPGSRGAFRFWRRPEGP